MKIIAAVFLPVLLNIIDYCVYLNFDGMIFFVSFIFNLIGIPIIFFWMVNFLIKRKNASRTLKSTLLSISSAIMLGMEISMTFIVWGDGRTFPVIVAHKFVWWLFCGISTLMNVMYRSDRGRSNILKNAILAFSVLGLIFNSLLEYILDLFNVAKYSIDGWEVVALITSASALSICSFLIGKTVSEPRKNVKLAAWFVAIAASDFVKWWLLDTPHTQPTVRMSSTLIWLLTSVVIFVWSLLGMALQNKRELRVNKEQETSAQTNNVKSRKKPVIISVSAFVAIIIAIYFIYFGTIFSKVYNDDVIIHSPDGKYTLIVKEWEAFGGGGADIYGVKSPSPNWIERLMPEKLGETTADIACQPFSRGAYEIDWGDKIIIRYNSGRGSGRDTVILEYPTNVPIYLNFTALVVLVVFVVTAITLIIIKIVRKRKRKTVEVCEE